MQHFMSVMDVRFTCRPCLASSVAQLGGPVVGAF